jgi:hypothetical protein
LQKAFIKPRLKCYRIFENYCVVALEWPRKNIHFLLKKRSKEEGTHLFSYDFRDDELDLQQIVTMPVAKNNKKVQKA